MGWVNIRNTIIAICVLSIVFLLGFGKTAHLGLTDEILNMGITIAHIIAAGLGFILFAFWQKYI